MERWRKLLNSSKTKYFLETREVKTRMWGIGSAENDMVSLHARLA